MKLKHTPTASRESTHKIKMIAVLLLLMAGLVSGAVNCPDGGQCPDKNTCCLTVTGKYACCHYPNAVCCSDKAHCCPQGYLCDLQLQKCVKSGMPWYSFPMFPQTAAENTEENLASPAVEVSSPSASVVHCDNYNVCPDGTTCCRTPYGQWHCCLYNIGHCCPDGVHCCPYGYTCDYTSTRCLRGALSLPAAPQIPAVRINTKQDQCCLSETGCCAIGFHCDEESKVCVSDFDPPVPVVPLEQALDGELQSGVIRCSSRFYCPVGNSCCKKLTGQWGCCPYILGQCCKDGNHCCEYGYNCDSTYTKCQKGYSVVPAGTKKNALIL